MTATETLAYCQELGWLAKATLEGWKGTAAVLLICCIWFGCRYHFDVGIRMPRLRRRAARLAGERDAAKREAIAAQADAESMRQKMATVAQEADKAIATADAQRARERAIRKKTEDSLTATKALLEDERDRAGSLEALLLAINDQQQRPAPGSPESWVPLVVGGTQAGELASK